MYGIVVGGKGDHRWAFAASIALLFPGGRFLVRLVGMDPLAVRETITGTSNCNCSKENENIYIKKIMSIGLSHVLSNAELTGPRTKRTLKRSRTCMLIDVEL